MTHRAWSEKVVAEGVGELGHHKGEAEHEVDQIVRVHQLPQIRLQKLGQAPVHCDALQYGGRKRLNNIKSIFRAWFVRSFYEFVPRLKWNLTGFT
jgi:hypothetical protein